MVSRQMKVSFLPVLGLTLFLAAPAQADLVVNGSFEQGNSGFTTNYIYSPGDVVPTRTFALVTDPAAAFPNPSAASSFGDHTTGSGLMMVVNGASLPGVLVWGQIVAVVPNNQYTLSAYIASWSGGSPGQLDVSINGTSLGTLTAPATTGVWVPFSATWDSGSATSAVIQLKNLSTSNLGNDFALDDIAFSGPNPFDAPEPASVVYVLTSSLALGLGSLSRRSQRQH
jgi:hypothetical protein